MDKTDNAAIGKPAPPTFTKKIGRTTYEVTVYFNENAREKLHKKLERIILNSVEKGYFL